MKPDTWRKLICFKRELNLNAILPSGQSFRWKQNYNGVWMSVLRNKVWGIYQDDGHLYYQVYEKGYGMSEKTHSSSQLLSTKNKTNLRQSNVIPNSGDVKIKKEFEDVLLHGNAILKTDSFISGTENSTTVKVEKENETILRDYFQLDVCLCDLYDKWAKVDANFKRVGSHLTGIRQFRQDPVENLFSFICSSNNNITRITGMVEKMCECYGEQIAVVDQVRYYAFPTVDSLAGVGVEEKLRGLGFGYRARYIAETARHITTTHPAGDWLDSLRQRPYAEARGELLKLTGVGPKVADCVCLMSLDKPHVIPIDTHVFQLALRDYGKYPQVSRHRGAKSVTQKIYTELGDFLHGLWGDYAGWTQSVLFIAELPQFKDVINGSTAEQKVKPKRKLQTKVEDTSSNCVKKIKRKKLN